MYEVVRDCKTAEEAIEKSVFRVGQLARLKSLHVTGDTDGQWTVIPRFEVIEEQENKPTENELCQGYQLKDQEV